MKPEEICVKWDEMNSYYYQNGEELTLNKNEFEKGKVVEETDTYKLIAKDFKDNVFFLECVWK